MSISGALVRSLAFLVCAAPVHSQSTSGATAPEAVRMIRLNAVALDNRGQPVADLTADDFRVTDQGRAERIVSFRNAGSALPAGAPGAHDYSNRPVPVPHTTAILFDVLNQGRADRLDAARNIGQSLKQLESGESVYFYLLTLDGSLSPIHPIAKTDDGSGKLWTQQIDTLLAKAMKSENGTRRAGMLDEEVVKKTYVALETLGNQLAAFPGRRDIIWVTNGVPNISNPKSTCSGDWIDCSLYVPHLSVTLERAGVVVNPISYSSLLGPDTNRLMEEMAALTGGRAYFSQDMRTLLAELSAESAGTYSIAYTPSGDNWDSKFHKLKVTCERKGVKVQARQRYYALPDQRPAPARAQAALVTAYQSPADVSDIGLHAAVSRVTDKKALRVEMRVDPAGLQLREEGGHFHAQITLLFSARTASGPQGDPALSTLDLHLTREQRDGAMKDGIPIAREYPIDDSIQNVRLIVLDHATNSVGSITIPVAAH